MTNWVLKQLMADCIGLQRHLCRDCGKLYNDRANTPMARLRPPVRVVSAALNVRSEGLGVRGPQALV